MKGWNKHKQSEGCLNVCYNWKKIDWIKENFRLNSHLELSNFLWKFWKFDLYFDTEIYQNNLTNDSSYVAVLCVYCFSRRIIRESLFACWKRKRIQKTKQATIFRILIGKKHPKIKLQRLRKIRIWAFGSLVHQINSF